MSAESNRIVVKPIADKVARPIWSVMIPTYNCAAFLEFTLQSVLQQDRGVEQMEIWVVDDHSTKDNPEEVVARLGKGRVKFFRQEKNVGQKLNFDTCLNLSTGHYIHLLHGDDIILPGFYNAIEKGLEDDKVGAVYTKNNYIDEFGTVFTEEKSAANETGVIKDFLLEITKNQLIQTPSIVVKRSVYETLGGFDKRLSWCEDWEMWVRIANSYQFYYVNETLASYRVHSNSNTGESLSSGRFIHDIKRAILIYGEYINLEKSLKQRTLINANLTWLNYAINQTNNFKRKGNYTISFKLLSKAKCFVVNAKTLYLYVNQWRHLSMSYLGLKK